MVSTLGKRLVACLLNVSEARRKDLVVKVAQAAITNSNGGWRAGTTVLNIFNDFDYNRSVITIVASIDHIREAVLSACEQACGLIDMSGHSGVHPCLGAVDLVPLYPLGEEVNLEDCAREAKALASELTQRVEGTSAFFFGWADTPQRRGLAQRRKEMGWFKKDPNMTSVQADLGPPPQKRFGLTGVGASPYVMNCNVTIGTQDLALGRRVAAALRESSPGGIPGVQVLALPHEGEVEIACNVEAIQQAAFKPPPPPTPSSVAGSGASSSPSWPSFNIGGQIYCHAPASLITARVAELAGRDGVATKGTALVGFTPVECRGLAEQALSLGIGEFWKERKKVHM
ncbi:formiminotransferase N-terminal subdomain-containing protein [Engraulis encrasicolus]|uniref:formiminotransferase N-terminal subdomain-containing protein n=1 Tax=Engraulis encrasicolus TaxID=184585 RepID=UPI002FD78B2C